MGNNNEHWSVDPSKTWEYAQELEASHSQRIMLDKATARNYYQRPVVRFDTDLGSTVTAHLDMFAGQKMLGFNLTRELVDTALPMVVRPIQERVLPVGADYEAYKACQQLTRLGRGILDANRIDELSQRVVMDAMVTTIGAAKVYIDEKSEIKVERVNPFTLFWPTAEGANPQTLIQTHSVPRRRLIAEYPDHEEAIRDLEEYQEPRITGVSGQKQFQRCDTVKVVEAWATRLGKLDGKHVICIGNTTRGDYKGGVDPAVLLDEVYKSEEHDIVPYRWAWDHDDYGGISVARIAAPMHTWSNRLVRVYYESLKGAVPVIWEHESEEAFQGISDFEFQRAKYNGATPPSITVANTVSTQIIDAIEGVRQRAYNETGIPFSIATGQKPVGLNSAPAQREWLDTLNIRIRQPQERYERFRQDLMEAICRLARRAYKSKAARVQAPGTDFLEEVKFPDLEEDKYKITVGISSGLSLTVSGRIDQVKELQSMGLVTSQRDVAKHLDLPDVRQLQDELGAPRALAEQMAYKALNDAEYVPPSRVQDLNELLAVCRSQYQMALKRDTYPAGNLAVLYRLIKVCEQRLTPPPAPAAPLGAEALPVAPPAMPGMVDPMAAPVAPLPGDVPPGMPPDAALPMPGPADAGATMADPAMDAANIPM